MAAYDVADKLLEKLSNAPECLESLEINSEAFSNVKRLLKRHNLQPDYDELCMVGKKKSNEVATDFRLKGNELFKDRNYFKALCAYNESLCFAEADCDTLGLAFANRSAVFLEIEEFDLCKENIELAKGSGYPAIKFIKLDKRKQLCQSKQQAKQMEASSFRLSHKANPKYPFIAGCLKLSCSSEYGRHIVTEETLKAGEIIAIEPPCSGLLLPTYAVKRCTNCFGPFTLNLMPCFECTSAMFCSKKCRTEADLRFHWIECGFSSENFVNFFTTAVKAALRTFLQGLSTFEGSIEKLKQYLTSADIWDVTVFDMDIKDATFQRDVFLATNALSSNEDKRSEVEKFRLAIVCSILSDFLKNHTRLSDALRSQDNEEFFSKFMFRHIQVAESNYHELYALSPQKLQQENEQFGVGSFPFSSLLNHSCAPNVFRLTFNGFNCIIVSRKIEKGEQVLDNYGFHHTLHNLRQRKRGLLERYQFTCKCQACMGNFPLFEQLPEIDENFDGFISNDLDFVESFQRNEAKNAIKKYAKYIDKHIEKYPCYEISLLQECILRCFRVLEKFQSKNNRKFIELAVESK